jgi:hypothetical protein
MAETGQSHETVALIQRKQLQVLTGWLVTQYGYIGQEKDLLPLSKPGPSVVQPLRLVCSHLRLDVTSCVLSANFHNEYTVSLH